MKIGVAITSYKRPDIFNRTFSTVEKYLPIGAELITVLDVSPIAKAKNMCLKYLQEKGCDVFYLLDDDVEVLSKYWWLPYAQSGQPHLMLNFRLPNKPQSDMRELYRDEKITAWSHTRGCMIFLTKEVLDTVGGFDEEYDFDFFHPDFTNRVHNAGLTTYRSMDVPNSHELLYCYDMDNKIESSIPESVRRANWSKNYKLYQMNKTSKEYKEYRK